MFVRSFHRNPEPPLSASRVAAAYALLAERVPSALPQARAARAVVATGVAGLDAILPGGGFQRARLTTWEPEIGAAALLRAACLHVIAGGERAVWIDGAHLVTGATWRAGPLLVRPHGPIAGLRAAETLARSGGFALVVVDGGVDDVEPAGAALRLARAAHEGGGALVLVGRTSAPAALRVTSRALPDGYDWRRSRSGGSDDVRAIRIQVTARASGWRAEAELSIPVWHDDLRLSPAPGRPDRRGARSIRHR